MNVLPRTHFADRVRAGRLEQTPKLSLGGAHERDETIALVRPTVSQT